MKANWTLAVAAAALCIGTGHASAQEFGLYSGPLTGEHSHSYAWSLDYTEGFGRYLAGSITCLDEGHIRDHQRDGPLMQVWGGCPLAQGRFVIAPGVGPYRYFDTEATEQGLGYSNTHGWGVVYSGRATWYSSALDSESATQSRAGNEGALDYCGHARRRLPVRRTGYAGHSRLRVAARARSRTMK